MIHIDVSKNGEYEQGDILIPLAFYASIFLKKQIGHNISVGAI